MVGQTAEIRAACPTTSPSSLFCLLQSDPLAADLLAIGRAHSRYVFYKDVVRQAAAKLQLHAPFGVLQKPIRVSPDTAMATLRRQGVVMRRWRWALGLLLLSRTLPGRGSNFRVPPTPSLPPTDRRQSAHLGWGSIWGSVGGIKPC